MKTLPGKENQYWFDTGDVGDEFILVPQDRLHGIGLFNIHKRVYPLRAHMLFAHTHDGKRLVIRSHKPIAQPRSLK